MNLPAVNIQHLADLVGIDIVGRPGGAVSLAVGMASIFSGIGGMSHLMNYWYQFMIMFEALFILTTIDAGTRVARYILQDIMGTYLYTPFKKTNWWPGNLLASLLVTVSWGYLLYSGDVASIWPLFGVANQLLAVVALAIGTTIILKIAPKKSYAWITLAPVVFLSITVMYAGALNLEMFFKRGDMLGNINGSVSIILMVLVAITLLDCIRNWLGLLKTEKPIGLNVEDHDDSMIGNPKPTIQN